MSGCRNRSRTRRRVCLPWNPEMARAFTRLWLDGSDLRTITGSSSVSAWSDKSGNSRHATTSVRHPSLLTGATNGLSAIKFTQASATKLDTTDFSLAPDRKFCSFVVASGSGLISSNTFPRLWIAKGTGDSQSAGSTYHQGFFGAGGSNNTAMQIAGGNGTVSPIVTGLPTTPLLLTGRFGTAGLGANVNSICQNGGTQSTLSGQTGALSTTGIRVGSDVGTATTSAWNSWVGEIILTGDISFELSRIFEGYLAWKWGTNSLLAANHPFKLRPPVAGD